MLFDEGYYLASIQAQADIGPPAKRHLNGVSLVGQSGPLLYKAIKLDMLGC